MFADKYMLFVLFASMASISNGSAFLRAGPQHSVGIVSMEDVQTSLLAEIEGSLGTGIAFRRITDMKSILSPMFAALPKNQHGNLDHVTVRYALHRAFVQRHGWSIKGLDPAGESWNASSPTGILKDRVPSYIQSLFEQRLGGRGLGLHELAVFAATIEHLVHSEAVGRLGAALNLHGLLPTASMSSEQSLDVLDTYMMAYILGQPLSNMTLLQARRLVDQMPEVVLSWKDTQAFVRKVHEETLVALGKSTVSPKDPVVEFATLVRIAETVGERFGKFQNAECKSMKASLVKMEDRGSGRIRLAEFYKPALDGAWQFQESVSYLRELGALDETKAASPRVMLANYLYSQSNCIASSDYYSVCCIDECENLFTHLENRIAAPEATPDQILNIISALPSSSVAAPRELSATLRSRLNDIAAHHGGSVQLHGRLFTQWMHHAYPHECAYPHLSGTTKQGSEDWSDTMTATEEELAQLTSGSDSSRHFADDESVHDSMMWSHEEELFTSPRSSSSAGRNSLSTVFRSIMFLAAVSSAGYALFNSASSAKVLNQKHEKYMV